MASILLSAVPAGYVFSLDLQTLISIGIQLLNTSVLAFALSYLLYKPVRNFLHKRTENIKTQFSRIEGELAKADELKAEYEKRLEDIERERVEILESARRIAIEKSREILGEAKKDADIIKARATADIEREQERVKADLKTYIIEASSVMAGKIVERSIDSELQDRLFAETLSELEDTKWLS